MAKQELQEQFISNPIPILQKLGLESERRLAAIAYVTRDWLQFTAEDLLICDASDSAIETGRTSRKLLRELSDAGVEIYSNSLLHAKVAVFDFATAFVGSANLSEFASLRIECGILTNNIASVESIVRFIYKVKSESNIIDQAFLDRIDRLRIIKRQRAETSWVKQTLDKLRSNGDRVNYWFFKGTRSLSRTAQLAGDAMKQKWSKHVNEPTSDDFDEIDRETDPLHFESLQHFGERWNHQLQLGDRILWAYQSDVWGWIVLPPRTVVSIKAHGKSVIAGTVGRYWDEDRSIYLDQVLGILELPENASLRLLGTNNKKVEQLVVQWEELSQG